MFLIIFEKKIEMRFLGYFLKGVSIFILVGLVFSTISAIKRVGNHADEDVAFVSGYIFGIVLSVLGMGWATYNLLKYSNRLIVNAKAKKEISTIGKE